MISIIIPLYNKAASVGRTLRSVLSQTYQDFEVVVVDDGSTDGGSDVVRAISDARVRLVYQENAGVSAARNRGIREARGEFVAFLDADDEWLPAYLETQHALTQCYPQCAVFATSYAIRSAGGEEAPAVLRRLPFTGGDGVLNNYFEVASCSHPPICSITVMVKRTAMEAIGGFPVGIRSGEDLLTWARLAVNYKIAFNRKPLVVYNLGSGYDFSNLPPRRQDENDPVGVQLDKLYRLNRQIPYFRAYISHWHQMRASVAIRYGERIETIKEVWIALIYNPWNLKVLSFLFLAFLPRNIRLLIIQHYRK